VSGLYAAMLCLNGRRCLVVGGGTVASRKVERLLDAEAEVQVVAPRLSAELSERAARGQIGWSARDYRVGDLDGATLVFAATSCPEVNRAVAAEARSLGIPVNVADDPAGSTFQVPAQLERGDLTLAISTGGRSPAYARRLREELERFLSPERLALFDLYAELRSDLAPGTRPPGRAWAAADEQVLELLRAGCRAEAFALLRGQVLAAEGA
jgi:precorrin-2 dehydrogenase